MPRRRQLLLGLGMGLLAFPWGNAQQMVVHRNLDYLPETEYANHKDRLDLFMPPGAQQVPVLLFFHGGALQRGDKSEEEFAARRFVPEGVGVVLANYRLSPAVMHPAHIQDAASAFAWVHENISRYGGDARRIYLAGQSAGAYLALLLSLDPRYLEAHGLGLSDIRATLASSPFTFVEEVAKTRPKTVWGSDPKIWMEASVTPYIGKDKPPILMVYADGDEDWRKEDILDLAAQLRQAGHPAIQTAEVPNRVHLTVWRDINQPDDQTALRFLEFMDRY